MNSTFYLHRTLRVDDKKYSEAALLAASPYIVVLAEPGAGKTRLMDSLARQLGATAVTANRFAHSSTQKGGSPLIIDAYDELAKVDASGIYKLLASAHDVNPPNLLISSRSSEWDYSATSAFKEFFGEPPLIARLLEFGEEEQRRIFEHHAPDEDFAAFRAQVSRFDLESLLPNPQFLTLFVDAYLQSRRHFTDKRSIFSQAVDRLAKEANPKIKTVSSSLSLPKKVSVTSEVFAKLLLSGAEGVTTSEAAEDKLYPLLGSLVENDTAIHTILATRLFKLGDTVDTHRPVHKIVAEYLAAEYLTNRIANPTDALSLEKCLPVIAPNSAVREELRGLVGWMASLGNGCIQEAMIGLDPYAVLANGDPSQLESSSKRLLVRLLKDIEKKDPYFRRGDFWRRFSIAGFFTTEVISEIKPLLSQDSEGHLRDLLLELLAGSPATMHLINELRAIALSPQEGEYTRLMAVNCLMDQGDAYNHHPDLAVLIFEASQTSLTVAAKVIENRDPKNFNTPYLSGFFRVCANLYLGHKERLERTIGTRHFVRHLVNLLDISTTKCILDDLTNGLTCCCGKENYECDCRDGISKVVGLLLDHYFELTSSPYNPEQVWRWVRNLNFHGGKSRKQSKSVEILHTDKHLRQGIIKHVFGPLTDKDKIFEKKIHSFGWHTHSGLGFFHDDIQYIVNLAFTTNNSSLWAAFMARHQYYRDTGDLGPDALRRKMREQALLKPGFMREWAKANRDAARFEREHHLSGSRHSRRMKRHHRRQNEIHAANIKYVKENREIVESGQHWACLVRFAELALMKPDKIEEELGDENLVRNALRNCLSFIAPRVPDLPKLAELQCASQYQQSETILYAACLEILKQVGNLNEVPANLLWALKTNLDINYDAVQEGEQEALKEEVNRLAFSNVEEAEQFCREYLEPQLLDPDCKHPQIHWLYHDPVFKSLAPSLAFEWLSNLELMSTTALDTLFEIVVQHGNRERLTDLIAHRSEEMHSSWPPGLSQEGLEQRRTFWYLRAFYFLESISNPYWDWLKSDKDNVLLFNHRSGRMTLNDHKTWPRLTSNKVEAILV